jgi:hypothetical protein
MDAYILTGFDVAGDGRRWLSMKVFLFFEDLELQSRGWHASGVTKRANS